MGNSHQSNQFGYSLIEIMAVMVVSVTIMAVGMSWFSTLQEHSSRLQTNATLSSTFRNLMDIEMTADHLKPLQLVGDPPTVSLTSAGPFMVNQNTTFPGGALRVESIKISASYSGSLVTKNFSLIPLFGFFQFPEAQAAPFLPSPLPTAMVPTNSWPVTSLGFLKALYQMSVSGTIVGKSYPVQVLSSQILVGVTNDQTVVQAIAVGQSEVTEKEDCRVTLNQLRDCNKNLVQRKIACMMNPNLQYFPPAGPSPARCEIASGICLPGYYSNDGGMTCDPLTPCTTNAQCAVGTTCVNNYCY